MPRFAANLSMMFTEHPFLDRFAAAADAGFTAVEYLFPYEHAPQALADRLSRHGLTQALFNLPPGDWAGGDRGTAALPERAAEFRASLETARPFIEATGVPRVHMMAGMASRADARAVAAYETALAQAADFAAGLGIGVVIEPINGRDMPGYFLNDFDWAAGVIGRLDRPNLRLQFDIYHRQILHGDVTKALEALMPITAHVQVASVPLRQEPGTGELNDARLFALLDSLGYQGFVGCEYRPAGETVAGLGWFKAAAGS
jgi:hydroxypyruvate isomerase